MPTNTHNKVYITSSGHYHPPYCLDNHFFEKLDIGSDPDWIMSRIGIETRYVLLPPDIITALRYNEIKLSDLQTDRTLVPNIGQFSKPAWDMLIERNPTYHGQPDYLTCATSIPDYTIPANACVIAAEIGISPVCFDLNSACSSFVVNLEVLSNSLKGGPHQSAAIFISERFCLRTDYSDRNSCILFGDACGAVIIENKLPQQGKALEVVDTVLVSDPAKYDQVIVPVYGLFYQNGRAVQKFAITKTMEMTQMLVERNGLTVKDCRYFISHQANLRMLHYVCEKLGIPEESHLYNVNTHGNQGGAGAVTVLSMNWDQYRDDDYIIMPFVGAGLTWGACLLKCIEC